MRNTFLLAACLSSALAASGATVHLKDKASVSGIIIAEKSDEIVLDIGYTVLVIPKNQIISLLKDKSPDAKSPDAPHPLETPAPATMPVPVATTSSAPAARTKADGFYSAGTAGAKDLTVRELAAELGAAVVQVRTPGGLGSGFFINEDGFLITNFHVTQDETQISVEVFQQRNGEIERKVYKQVKIVSLNKFGDLALLKVEDKDAPKFAHVSLGDSDTLAVGEHVFAIGSPLGLERSVTEGIVSTKTRQMQGDLYIQTTTQINPGNSGGPLFNMRGEVVGVTNMKITSGEGLGFCIPVDAVVFFLKHRDSFAYDNDNPSSGYRYLPPSSHFKKATPE